MIHYNDNNDNNNQTWFRVKKKSRATGLYQVSTKCKRCCLHFSHTLFETRAQTLHDTTAEIVIICQIKG